MSIALLGMLDRGERTPCRAINAAGMDWHTSDDQAEREAAAYQCQRCPLLDACREYADEIRPRLTFGVFGAHDFGRRTATSRPKTEEKK